MSNDIEFYTLNANVYIEKTNVTKITETLKYSPLASGMVLYIDEKLKKKILIRKINKNFKDNKIDIEITNKLEKANTFVLEGTIADSYHENSGLFNSQNQLVTVKYTGYHNSQPLTALPGEHLKQLTQITGNISYVKKQMGISVHDIYDKVINGDLKFVDIKELKTVSIDEYKNQSAEITIDPTKVKLLIQDSDTCKLLCSALRNKDITPYLDDIIAGYYMTNDSNCRTYLRDRLLKYYGLDQHFYSISGYSPQERKHYYYLSTMERLNRTPDKEIVLELVGYYKK